MPGTKIGGQKAAITNKKKHGEDFYKNIGRKGGRNGHTGGFASNPELAKLAGQKGGKISRRRPKEVIEKEKQESINKFKNEIINNWDEIEKTLIKLGALDQDFIEDQKFIKKISW